MVSGRDVRLRYYAYEAATTMGPYLPVHVVYVLDQGYGVGFVALMQAVFSVTLLAMELPTGYLGDRLGRRWTLVLGNTCRVGGVLGYVLVDAAAGFLALKVLTGTGWAFRSGTVDAWLYELLATHDDPGEFARVSGRGSTAVLATSAVGAVVGGVLYGVHHALPFLLTAGVGALTLPILLSFPSAATDRIDEDEGAHSSSSLSVRDAIHALRAQVRRPAVRWVVAYSVLVFLVFDLSRTFEQPALESVGVPVAGMGLLYAGFKLFSAAAASTTGWLTDTLGVRGTLALAAPVLGLAYAAVAVVPLAIVPVLFLYRGGRSVLKPVRNHYLNERLEDVGRATVLSGASMVLSLAGAVARLGGGYAAARIGPIPFFAAAGVGLSLAAGVLWLAVSPVRPADSTTGVPADD